MPTPREKKWEIKTRADLIGPRLEALHPVSTQLIKEAYRSIDEVYGRASEILDRYGVHTQPRLIYRSFTEELWKFSKKYTSKTLETEADAVSVKYVMYGCEEEILLEIGRLFNLEVFTQIPEIFGLEALEYMAITLNKGFGAAVDVTETTPTLKHEVTPDRTIIMCFEGAHVIATNPSGSGATLTFSVRLLLDDDSEVLLDSEDLAEGASFDDWLRFVLDAVSNTRRVKAVRLYGSCNIAPNGGFEPTVRLAKVCGVQV